MGVNSQGVTIVQYDREAGTALHQRNAGDEGMVERRKDIPKFTKGEITISHLGHGSKGRGAILFKHSSWEEDVYVPMFVEGNRDATLELVFRAKLHRPEEKCS